jgi:hypothetical protein|tara:strand:+ start:2643 stop:4097 length:1455 start_codon:yes stop_codon:yes gene_type:complete
MVSRARTFASFAKSMEDKTFVNSPISGTTSKSGTINIPLDTQNFTDFEIGQSSTAGKMVDPTTGNVTLTFAQANEANKKFTLHFQIGYDTTLSSTAGYQGKIHNGRHLMEDQIYSSTSTFSSTYRGVDFGFNNDGTILYQLETEEGDKLYQFPLREKYNPVSAIKGNIITLVGESTTATSTTLGASNAGANADSGLDRNVGEWMRVRYVFTNNSGQTTTTDFGPTGFTFKPDGTRCYTLGTSTDRVTQYDLSTPFDITTSTVMTSDSFNVNTTAGEANPYKIRFKPDGTRMFIGGLSTNTIHIFSLSTAWDVTTASHEGNIGITFNDGIAYEFSADGRFLYWLMDDQRGDLKVYDCKPGNEWNWLSTEWDSTSADHFSLGSNNGGSATGNRVTESRIFGRAFSYTSPTTLRLIDNNCLLAGDAQNHRYIVYELGDNFELNMPSSVKDIMPKILRGYRYQVDLSSTNANSGSAEWYITDVRSIRV